MKRLHPVDFLLGFLLLFSALYGYFCANQQARQIGLMLALLTLLFFALATLAARSKTALYHQLRPIFTVAIVFFLYSALGKLGLACSGNRTFDSALSSIDSWLFGFDPSNRIQYIMPAAAYGFLGFCYAFFIPYIHLSLFLGLEARSGNDRNSFLTSWCLLYCLSYLGYVLVPANGPAMYPLEHAHFPLPQNYFSDLIINGIAATGGYFGAFPSLHVGASIFLCRADWSRDKLRTLAYLPIVLGICVATIALRFHYVIDIIVGACLAYSCQPLGSKIWQTWGEDECIPC